MDPILWPDVAGFNLTGHLLLVARRGSESHNTYIKPTDPNSVDDRDIYAVACPPRRYYTGLSRWEHAGWKSAATSNCQAERAPSSTLCLPAHSCGS